MTDTVALPILIAGAGPSGLLLAIWLTHFGVAHRIVDSNATTGTESRALIVHARSLEFYDQLGFADQLVEAGSKLETVRIRYKGQEKACIQTGSAGQGESKFPFALCLGQDAHEAFLLKELERRGGKVEWNSRVMKVEDKGEWVEVVIAKDGSSEFVQALYVAGCDGAHSIVRREAGIDMQGSTYPRRSFVADVHGVGSAFDTHGSMTMCISPKDYCLVIRTKGDSARLVGFTPDERGADVTFEDCLPGIQGATGGVTINKVDWFSHYTVHCRHADTFRKGRTFIFGDAAHLHSPVGGQGMNTGLGDVTNFAWKFATFLKTGNEALLDTYDTERSAFARLLVRTTDRAFTTLTGKTNLSQMLRTFVMPTVIPLVLKVVDPAPTLYARTSQLAIAYPKSPLSVNTKVGGKVKAGDRLPFVEDADDKTDRRGNHKPLDGKDWQIHVYGDVATNAAELDQLPVVLHVYSWNASLKAKGLVKDAIYLIRPDGYIAMASGKLPSGVKEYMDKWGVGVLSGDK